MGTMVTEYGYGKSLQNNFSAKTSKIFRIIMLMKFIMLIGVYCCILPFDKP